MPDRFPRRWLFRPPVPVALGCGLLGILLVLAAARSSGPAIELSRTLAFFLALGFLAAVGSAIFSFIRILAVRRRAQAAARAADAALEATMQAIPAMVMVARDAACRVITGNRHAYEKLRVPLRRNLSKSAPAHEQPREFSARSNGRLLSAEELPMQRAASTGKPVLGEEIEWVFAGGETEHYLANAVPVVDTEGGVTGCVAVFVDITGRKRAELALRESEERFRTVASHAPVGIFRSDARGDALYVNSSWCTMAGLSPEQSMGKGWLQAVHPDDRAQVAAGWDQAVASGAPSSAEFRFQRSDGAVVWVQGSAVPLQDAAGHLTGYVGSVADITGIKRAEEELRRLNEDLEARVAQRTSALQQANEELKREFVERQRLEEELLDVSEREQRRLGEDLHEGLGSQLAGMGFLCQVLADRLAAEAHSQAASAKELNGLLLQSLDIARNLARSSYPVELETGGLGAALEGLAERTGQVYGVRCEFHNRQQSEFFDDGSAAIHVYRIVQEAVTNAMKHGKAKLITIECGSENGMMMVTVTDDGSGFDPGEEPEGMGLHLMGYRARLIGAKLEVRRGESSGCVVSCAWKAP